MSPEHTDGPVATGIALAIVDTLAYSDVFDYPLTLAQIRRYLPCLAASEVEVDAALGGDPWLAPRVERHGDYYCFAGRGAVVALRQERGRYAAGLWRRAAVLTYLIAALPFVRMVAIIGSLTMANVRSPQDDIDVFIVTLPGRVWLARAFVILLVRMARLAGTDLCPNYILSTERLAMPPDDLFTARELTQMLPMYGRRVYEELLTANGWLAHYLPNAAPRQERLRELGLGARAVQCILEWGLGGRAGDRLEARLQAGKLRDLQAEARIRGSREVVLEPEVCKGHMDSHGNRIGAEYQRRRARYMAADGIAAKFPEPDRDRETSA